MKKQAVLISLITLALAGLFPVLADSVDLNYSVRATMHTVEGIAEAEPFDALLQGEGEAQTLTLTINVPMESMDTGNKKRDAEMRHVLREDLQAVLVGTLAPKPVAELKPSPETPGQMVLTFSMAGQELPVEATVQEWEETDEKIDFTVSFDLSQRAYGLEPISKIGMLKVKDTVHVVARFEIEK